jgi:uncharacterized protein (TIGR02271 family)
MSPTKPTHEHPGGDQPHRHNGGDELATHGTGDDRSRAGSTRQQSEQTVQLREEELQARKQPVETGRVQVGKEIVEEQRTLNVPVTREEVTVERHAVSRRPSDTPIGEDDKSIRVPVREEQVSVEKRPVVTEEISVGKQVVQETQQVSGTVRREEARIEGEGNVDVERRR